MTTDKQDNDSVVSQLISWLNKHAETKQSDLEPDAHQRDLENVTLEQSVAILSQTLTKCIGEVTKVALSLSSTIKAVNEHSAMIEELYAVQSSILKLLKTSAATTTSVQDSSSSYDKNKKKTEKPN